jgi:ABC-2 type transport system ATP-binding protein
VPALAVENVSHAYGQKRVLEGVTFAVAQGSFTVLLGLNGAGKSTLFALITRLYDTKAGRIVVLGHDIGREPGEALRRLGVVFQSRTVDLDLTVNQNLSYHAALHGIPGRAARDRIAEVLAGLGLSEKARDKVRSLSGGQMRRVEIARALLHHPRLLLLDEATVGLDIRSRTEMVQEVRKLVSQGVGVLWATHLIDEVGPTDDVVVLHHGKVMAAGPLAEVNRVAGVGDIRDAFAKLTGTAREKMQVEAAA